MARKRYKAEEIIAGVLFFIIQVMNRMMKKEKPVEKQPEPSAEVRLLTDIRDLLSRRPTL